MNNNKKKTWHQVSVSHSAEMAALHQKSGMTIKELVEMFPQYSQRSIYRHAKKPFNQEAPHDKRKFNKGQPPKLTFRDKRTILRMIKILRWREGSFSAKRLALAAGVINKISMRAFRKFLNHSGYYYLQTRKKGLLKHSDLKKRVQWCHKIKKLKLGLPFWTTGISFYLDGKGFAWKSNPLDQAIAPKSRIWRKRNEGLAVGCTGKAGKSGVTNLNFMVGISYDKGVVLCERYIGSITGEKFANIIKEHFPSSFRKSINPKAKRILQDNCPRQNSAAAMKALYMVNGKLFKIPSRSPDLNPIENFFHLISKELEQQAIEKEITQESQGEFEARIISTMESFDKSKINHLLESMPNRVNMVLKSGGKRIKY